VAVPPETARAVVAGGARKARHHVLAAERASACVACASGAAARATPAQRAEGRAAPPGQRSAGAAGGRGGAAASGRECAAAAERFRTRRQTTRLDGARQDVPIVRQARGKGRAVVEDIPARGRSAQAVRSARERVTRSEPFCSVARSASVCVCVRVRSVGRTPACPPSASAAS
jgi:hypothetical protein